ncbi:hypothetical protein PILCRDRAFT_818573 [Piloderma croceum F 1598]|uniref:Uncharacterized protein n=1 Tax=Piloderma croceum (strain F 1598) TaxID=765440 RepID=A0A0C3C3P8_PILCF|nr:hypothetical protein PILCRDRAFT_818573 [Piloderma croceum F 1598]
MIMMINFESCLHPRAPRSISSIDNSQPPHPKPVTALTPIISIVAISWYLQLASTVPAEARILLQSAVHCLANV